MFESFFEFLYELVTYPLHIYTDCLSTNNNLRGTCTRDWFGTIFFGLIIWGTILFVAALAIMGTYVGVTWFVQAKQCQHDECDHTWTTDLSDGDVPHCIADQACCNECHARHKTEAAENRARVEPRIPCPYLHGPMAKVVSADIVIDECRSCGTVVLNSGELEIINHRAHEQGRSEGHSQGSSTGMSNGLLLGMIIG